MNSYEQRQEARRERLLRIAEKLEAEGNARYQRARQMASAIPFGQPILVGHHSEKRDRNYRARIHTNFGKAFEASAKAKEFAARAAAVGTGGVSSDDPEAVAKLREQLVGLENRRQRMLAVNKAHKAYKAGKTWSAGLSAEEQRKVVEYVPAYGWEPHPFAPYQLQNLGANIRRIKARIEQLEARAEKVAAAEAAGETRKVHECTGYQVIENIEANRLQVKFPGKPSHEVRKLLKSHGFRWAPSEGAWQRMLGGFWIGFLTQPDQHLRKQLEAAVGGAA